MDTKLSDTGLFPCTCCMTIHPWSHVCNEQLDEEFVHQLQHDCLIEEICATENCQNKLGIEFGSEIHCNDCRLDQYQQEYDDEYLQGDNM